jgi:hypothetical protein
MRRECCSGERMKCPPPLPSFIIGSSIYLFTTVQLRVSRILVHFIINFLNKYFIFFDEIKD